MNLGLIGAGKVGTAVITRLYKRYRVVGVWDIDKRRERRCYRRIGIQVEHLSLGELIEKADIILIATPDREIEGIYKRIKGAVRGKSLIHFSGVLSSKIFKKRGIGRASIHPIQTFPSLGSTIRPGLYYGIEGNSKGLRIAKEIVKAMEGKYIPLSSDLKPLYHTMCVVASNFLVGILDLVIELGKVLKLRPERSIEILSPLIDQTLKNVKDFGSTKALSGPIERGDAETVARHISFLKRYAPQFIDLYISISSHLLTMAREKKSISPSEERRILKLLRKPNG